MTVFRQIFRNLSLWMVNLAGLSIVFACLLLSASYIKRELSYDCHHTNANRIARLSLQFGEDPVDGRVLGNNLDDILPQMPEIERVVKMFRIYSAVVTYHENNLVANDLYMVNREFLRVFDLPLLEGNKDDVLQREDQLLISESFARKLSGELELGKILMSEIVINGKPFFISGIFKDIPATAHFKTDVLLYRPDDLQSYTYVYLLVKEQTDYKKLAQKITSLAQEKEVYKLLNPSAILMPLTDIHLYSHNLREMGVNGNIYYIYLIAGANILLLIVVLFNLWLNGSLIFSYNRRYYQLMRLHGAPCSEVIKNEFILALILALLSIYVGVTAAYCVWSFELIPGQISVFEIIALSLGFLLLVIAVSLLPAFKGISYTLLLATDQTLKPIRFSYSNVKWMLIIQYAVVMVVVILAIGIYKQMNLVEATQVGGNEQTLLVLNKQPDQVGANYQLLKDKLLKNVEIEGVTSVFQVPGDAVRDAASVKLDGSAQWHSLPILVAGEGFLPFFQIDLIAGRGFTPAKYDYPAEMNMLMSRINSQKFSEHVEEYVINRKALAILGFKTPDEAIGKTMQLEQGTIDYFQRGVIVGVTDDFNYTGVYEQTIPLLVMQRRMFQSCIMVRLNPARFTQALSTFNKVWQEVNPNYPANYVFMSDVFGTMYSNEINARQLVFIFSLLCFGIADLGLIVFMAFIIRRRTREISIRKIHGAGVGSIIGMLNMNFIRYIAIAFVIAVPVAWYIMHRWLERFAYRTSLDWWVFVLAGGIVLIISFACVSLQSWHAATLNPVKGIVK